MRISNNAMEMRIRIVVKVAGTTTNREITEEKATPEYPHIRKIGAAT